MTSDQPVVSIFQASFDGAQVNGVLNAPGVLREGAEVNRGIEGLGHRVFHHSFQPAQDPLCLSFPTSRRPLAGFGRVQHVLQLLWVRWNSTANAGWHHWMLTQRVRIFVITFSFFIFPVGNVGHRTWLQRPQGQCDPFLLVCQYFRCLNNAMAATAWDFNVCTDEEDCNCTGGLH